MKSNFYRILLWYFCRSIMNYIMDSFIGRWMMNTRSVETGRDSLLKLALDPELCNTTGVFFVDNKPSDETPEVEEEENKAKIWQLCVKYSGFE